MRGFLNRLISCALSACLLVTAIPIGAFASTANSDMASIRVSDGASIHTYGVVLKDEEIHFSAEDLGRLTGCAFESGDGVYAYRLGKKIMVVDPASGEMEIPLLHHQERIGEAVEVDGVDYLPASKLLPWLNVECRVEDGVLLVERDAVSLWEAVEGLGNSSYTFSLYEDWGDDAWSVTSMAAMIVFDGFLNLRIERLMPTGQGGTLYDYQCCVQALSELGAGEELFGADLLSDIQDQVSVNGELSTFGEFLGMSEADSVSGLSEPLLSAGLDRDAVDTVTGVGELWESVRGILGDLQIKEALGDPDLFSSYVDVFSAVRAYDLIVKTDNDYREYLEWMLEQGTGSGVFDLALSETLMRLDENRGVIYTLLAGFAEEMLSAFPDEALAALGGASLGEEAARVLGGCSDALSAFGSLQAYTAVSKIIFSAILPEAVSGYEGMAKASILQSIQDHCRSLANNLQSSNLTVDNIERIRLSYLTSLRAARQLFVSQQESFDGSPLGALFDAYNAEGLLDDRIVLIDAKIAQLVASAGSELNDSIDGKSDKSAALLSLFSQMDKMDAPKAGEREFLAYLKDHPKYNYYALVDVNLDGTPEMLAAEQVDAEGSSSFSNYVDLFVWKDGAVALAYGGLWSKYEHLSYDSRNRLIACSTGWPQVSAYVYVGLDKTLSTIEETVEFHYMDEGSGDVLARIYRNGDGVMGEERSYYEGLAKQRETGRLETIYFKPVVKEAPGEDEGFCRSHRLGTTVCYDLDGDGAAERLSVEEVEGHARVVVNGVAGEFEQWLYNPTGYFTVLNVDGRGESLFIGVSDHGPSADEMTYIYMFEAGEVSYVGNFDDFLGESMYGGYAVTASCNGDGTLSATTRMNVLGTWGAGATYAISKAGVEDITDFYRYVNYADLAHYTEGGQSRGWEAVLECDVPMRQERGIAKPSTLIPSGTTVYLTGCASQQEDGYFWVAFESDAFKGIMWVCTKPEVARYAPYVETLQGEVSSMEAFRGLFFAG